MSDPMRDYLEQREKALEARIAKLEARINDLDLALHTIVGHGNITVERAKLVAANALAKNCQESLLGLSAGTQGY